MLRQTVRDGRRRRWPGAAGPACPLAAFWARFHSRTSASARGRRCRRPRGGRRRTCRPPRASRPAARPASCRGWRRRCAPSRRRSRARPQPAVQLGAVVDAGPDAPRRARRSGGRARRTGRGSAGRRGREAMDRRLLAAHGDEVVHVHRRDPAGVEVAEAPPQRRRAGERPLHRHLLVEQHADQQRRAVAVEQPVGIGVPGDVQRPGRGSAVGHRPRGLAIERLGAGALGRPAGPVRARVAGSEVGVDRTRRSPSRPSPARHGPRRPGR